MTGARSGQTDGRNCILLILSGIEHLLLRAGPFPCSGSLHLPADALQELLALQLHKGLLVGAGQYRSCFLPTLRCVESVI